MRTKPWSVLFREDFSGAVPGVRTSIGIVAERVECVDVERFERGAYA